MFQWCSWVLCFVFVHSTVLMDNQMVVLLNCTHSFILMLFAQADELSSGSANLELDCPSAAAPHSYNQNFRTEAGIIQIQLRVSITMVLLSSLKLWWLKGLSSQFWKVSFQHLFIEKFISLSRARWIKWRFFSSFSDSFPTFCVQYRTSWTLCCNLQN